MSDGNRQPRRFPISLIAIAVLVLIGILAGETRTPDLGITNSPDTSDWDPIEVQLPVFVDLAECGFAL